MTIRMAQYGTKHGHAAGKAQAMARNAGVELVGLYEPDQSLWPRLAASPAYAGVRLLRSAEELLGDSTIEAVAIEGSNAESLAMATQAIAAGKHLWYDKPAGDDWAAFQQLISEARERRLLVQMGYMFRYQHAFRQVAEWARGGLLGQVFAVRAHMSTSLPVRAAGGTATARADLAGHPGGIFYDLGGHMLDQVVWLLGRPTRVTAFLRNDATPEVAAFTDNALGVFEFARAMAFVDIAAMEPRPTARRFEVYGTRGSAIIPEPFEVAGRLRLCLEPPAGPYVAGEQEIRVPVQTRQELYDLELVAFVATLQGKQQPVRSLDHELLVQETLLRATRGDWTAS